jgi:hypothetical protein
MFWRSASAVLLFVAVMLIESCALRRPTSMSSTAQSPEPPPIPQSEIRNPKSPFESSIRPVLAARCAPCHEPGGKMYERLPFDDPKTISSNADGIRKRLKGEDREALERWLASLPESTPRPE